MTVTEQQHYSAAQLALTADLRKAIERDELLLHWQPEVSLATAEPISVEALVRWSHPTRGMLAPAQFIPVAESASLMGPLLRWVLNAALEQCHKWQAAGLDLPVSVNMSVRNLVEPELGEVVERHLKKWQVDPSMLTLEITESAPLIEMVRSLRNLSTLRRLGVQLSIDDFGTCYSSMTYLDQLPVHTLKIDRSFICEMTRRERSATLVRAMIDLGHALDLRVVAEGIEDEDTWRALADARSDSCQGYFIARPMPAADLERWLREWRLHGPGRLATPAARGA